MASIDSQSERTTQASSASTPATPASSSPHSTNQVEKDTEPRAQTSAAQPSATTTSHSVDTQPTNTAHATSSSVPNGIADASDPRQPPASSSSAQPTATAHVNGEASSKPNAEEPEKVKDAEKASLNTSTHTHTRTQSTRQKETKSASELAHTATTAAEEPKKTKAASKKGKAKASLFSRLFHVFVPCVSPGKAHSLDIDAIKQDPAGPEPSTSELQEKQAPKEDEQLPSGSTQPEPATSTEEPSRPSAQEARTEDSMTPLQPIEVPPPSDDPSVIVPPTPTKVVPEEETHGMTSAAVQPPGSGVPDHEHRNRDSDKDSDGSTSYTDEDDIEEANAMDEVEDEEERLIMNGGAGIPIGPDGLPRPLLPPLSPKHAGRKCLVLDLDETLVHSSFKSIQQADYVVPVEIEYHWHNVYVIKRPGVDNFLKKMGEIYEVVVFTASLSKYADPVLDKLDIHHVVSHRLFRESCYNHRGNYVKDLSQLGRPIADTIIIDNSPASYIFHPNNAVPVSSWFNDPHDTELTDLVPFLADLGQTDDVRGVLDGGL